MEEIDVNLYDAWLDLEIRLVVGEVIRVEVSIYTPSKHC